MHKEILSDSVSTVSRQRLTRQRLTPFLKILEIFRIPKFFGELCQNPQFLVKIIFGVTLILYRYRIVLILTKNYGFVTLIHKKNFFLDQKYGKMQSKIGTPKIGTPKIVTPKIDAFSSFEHY